jgi:hypothetical protein
VKFKDAYHRKTHRGMCDPMYKRTQNENGTLNTRCLYCFFTVASSIDCEAELERSEAAHMCPEKALALLLAENPGAVATLQHKD